MERFSIENLSFLHNCSYFYIMNNYYPSKKPNTRIDVADVLRGIAIGGIILIHFVEHMNFFSYPEPSSAFWAGVNSAVQDVIFFLFAGKMYAIFALLFGLSFFIQHDNQAQKGRDFRLRFAWRMVLLMLFGLFDLLFYNGDILLIYAVCGLLVLPFIRASDKVMKWLAFILMLQPVELTCIAVGLLNPEAAPLNLGSGKMYFSLIPVLTDGSILDAAAAGIKYGIPVNFAWAIENGRFTQNIMLFIVGILIGRKRLFYNEGDNLKFWDNLLLWSFVAMAVLIPMQKNIPGLVEVPIISASLSTLLTMWRNLAMMSVIVSFVVTLFYESRCRAALLKIAPYGKMSLTNYIGQSIIGAFLFYGWGLGLHRFCGVTVSVLMGVVLIILQCWFSTWWLKHHKRGPLEGFWHKLTWLNSK